MRDTGGEEGCGGRRGGSHNDSRERRRLNLDVHPLHTQQSHGREPE